MIFTYHSRQKRDYMVATIKLKFFTMQAVFYGSLKNTQSKKQQSRIIIIV